MAKRVQGAARIKAILKGLPDAYREEMADAMEGGGKSLVPAMRALAPKRTGKLQEGISYQVNRRTLRMKVGLLSTKAGRSDLFYGRIQDLGRKAQVVKARRAGGNPYLLRVRAMAGKHFVTGRFPDLRETMNKAVRGIFQRALGRITGASDQ